MTRLASLPTDTDAPRAIPKVGSKLKRAITAKAGRRADALKLVAWAKAVKDRDRWKDRRTGVKVFRTAALDPLRAEAHHIVDKAHRATRHDVRNGICLSFATHFLVEHNELRIVGTAWFWIAGVRYIDGTFPVRFVRV
jgi:hypothetical protein